MMPLSLHQSSKFPPPATFSDDVDDSAVFPLLTDGFLDEKLIAFCFAFVALIRYFSSNNFQPTEKTK